MPLSQQHCLPSRHQPAHLAYPSESRRSRYGRNHFALDPHFLCATALDASSPAPGRQKHQAVRLSAFDITSPTLPASNAPPLDSSTMPTKPPRPTRTRDQRLKTSPRARTRSPTPSLTSMSACSSNDIPAMPLTSDDKEWQVVADREPPQPDSSSLLRIQKEIGWARTRCHGTHANLARSSRSPTHARLSALARARAQS